MNIHTSTITLTDRVALSNDLYELSESFIAEAMRWRPSKRRDIERNSRVLAELARGVLSGAANYQRAEAFADAGAILLAETQGQRKTIAAQLFTVDHRKPRRYPRGADRA